MLTATLKKLGIRTILERNYKSYTTDSWSFYPKWIKGAFKVGPASYFDNRLYIHTSLTCILFLLLLPLFWIYAPWYITWSVALLNFIVGWGSVYLHLPIYSKWDECNPPRYGYYWYGEGGWQPTSFWVLYGLEKTKCFYMPWAYDWYRSSMLMKDGTWEHEIKGGRRDAEFYNEEKWPQAYRETFFYFYTLKSGEIQNRLATVTVREMEHRQKWLMWTKNFNKVRRSIDIQFNDEVGERTGSWKGGCTRCGYDLKPNETPLQCLRRMEKERKF